MKPFSSPFPSLCASVCALSFLVPVLGHAQSPAPSPSLGPVHWQAACKVTKLGVGEARHGVEAVLVGDLRDGNASLLPKGTSISAEPGAGASVETLFSGGPTKWMLVHPPTGLDSESTMTSAALSGSARLTGKAGGTLKAGTTFELVATGFSVNVSVKPASKSVAATPSASPTPVSISTPAPSPLPSPKSS